MHWAFAPFCFLLFVQYKIPQSEEGSNVTIIQSDLHRVMALCIPYGKLPCEFWSTEESSSTSCVIHVQKCHFYDGQSHSSDSTLKTQWG